MSSSLLRKSLELCESEFVTSITGGQEKSSKVKTVKAEKKKKQQRGAADVQWRNINSIEHVKKQLRKQKNQEKNNLKVLKLLKKPVVDEKLAKQILQHIRKPGVPDKDIIFLKEEPQSCFTEEDFRRFEQEYQDDE